MLVMLMLIITSQMYSPIC